MTTQRKFRSIVERGRRLASQREDFIAAGGDPAELTAERYELLRSRRLARHARLADPDVEKRHAADLARVWLVVVVACVAAFAGCVATAGAMLMVTQEPTWHVWAAATAGLGWFVAGCTFAVHVDRLHRWARGEESAPLE